MPSCPKSRRENASYHKLYQEHERNESKNRADDDACECAVCEVVVARRTGYGAHGYDDGSVVVVLAELSEKHDRYLNTVSF